MKTKDPNFVTAEDIINHLGLKKKRSVRYLNRGGFVLLIDSIYFVIYNSIYGWNKTPINETEKTLDKIFIWFIFLGFTLYLIPLFKIYRRKVEELD